MRPVVWFWSQMLPAKARTFVSRHAEGQNCILKAVAKAGRSQIRAMLCKWETTARFLAVKLVNISAFSVNFRDNKRVNSADLFFMFCPDTCGGWFFYSVCLEWVDHSRHGESSWWHTVHMYDHWLIAACYLVDWMFLSPFIQSFDAVGWATGRASGLWKNLEWWGAGMVICLERGADLHMAQLMPLPLTDSWIQIGFTFLIPARPAKRAIKRACASVILGS